MNKTRPPEILSAAKDDIWKLVCNGRKLAFHDHRHTLAAANAKGSQAIAGITPLHLIEQGHEDAGAARTDGMPQRNRAAVHIELVPVETEFLAHSHRLRGEGLISFNQVDIGHL